MSMPVQCDEKHFFKNAFSLFSFSLFILVGGLVACASEDATRVAVIAVPADAPTIEAAVAMAKRGTTIEIASGVYNESVSVNVPGITIRGVDRNTTILDGEFELANGFQIQADDVAIENLTVRHYNQNGILFNGVAATSEDGLDPSIEYGTGDTVLDGYRVSWVTAHNNGLYGVYAFAARNGLIEHSYASGHPDSGFYVGQCRPCNVTLFDVTAEFNAIGYYGTNVSGDVIVASSEFSRNRLGLAHNSDEAEGLAPQTEAVIVGNRVVDNDNALAPPIPKGYFGGGIAIGGGTQNMILRNRVSGHDRAGIELLESFGYVPQDNRIEGNVLEGNAVDLLYLVADGDEAGNCFIGNTFSRSLPEKIEELLPCGESATSFDVPVFTLPVAPGSIDFRTVPPPGPQPSMPDSARRIMAGAGERTVLDYSAIGVPT